MKKSLVALAALAVAGVASAQSSVTLFGIVDASVSHVTNKSDLYVANPLAPANIWLPGSLKSSKTGLNNSAYNSSRIGFRGVEDLGGGLAASFWLEAGNMSNDDGSNGINNFQRRSTVSLSGNFGEVRLGRDYKPTFWNFTVFDPFGTNGAGTALIQRAVIEQGNVRASNTIGYFLPKNLGGFYGQVQYAFHEKAKFSNDLQGSLGDDSRGGRYWGGRFGYANGPLDVAVAYGETNQGSSWTAGSNHIAKNFNVGASYDFGVVKLFGQYARVKAKNEFSNDMGGFNPAQKGDGYLLGLTAPVGAGLIRASYGRVTIKNDVDPAIWLANPFYTVEHPKADQLAVGYVHNLSKRTALYATVAYIKNKNGANYSAGSGNIKANYVTSYTSSLGGAAGVYQPKTSIGYDLGIRHSF
ncbi:porin [Xenophilus sp. Marseille-Q4582]|uniref:porin n=1 Tax=Xenophilus sp. Marseille-Q4582 TaxID=2866600 RepID=UPI001CE483C8|nr:porin [Xenophilus sp. Marseille-Q4582]